MCWVAVEFWINRYQTIIAAVAAFIGVLIVLRPMWRQVEIMDAQRKSETRERLAATYRMLRTAMDILDPEAWRAEAAFSQRPSDERMAEPDFPDAARVAYKQRKQMWADRMKALKALPLTASQMEGFAEDLALVDRVFGASDNHLDPKWHQAAHHRPLADNGELYWYTVDYPDIGGVIPALVSIREKLEKISSQVVDKIVSADP
jgi:hypothetical protein